MLSWLMELFCAAALALMLRVWVINLVRISGQSMLPTLCNRDIVLVWRLPYRFRKPRRGEIVICHYPNRRMRRCRFLPQAFVKRVVGLPGDTLEIVEGTVYINGEPLDEPYLDPEHCRFRSTRPARLLGQDEFFVMGDNRDRSNDSRTVGPIGRKAIRGRVLFILWPLKRLGKTR